jgi:hypothetical protein
MKILGCTGTNLKAPIYSNVKDAYGIKRALSKNNYSHTRKTHITITYLVLMLHSGVSVCIGHALSTKYNHLFLTSIYFLIIHVLTSMYIYVRSDSFSTILKD